MSKPVLLEKPGVSDVFEILSELAILTSDILGSSSGTTRSNFRGSAAAASCG
jgi:hypothetical protein